MAELNVTQCNAIQVAIASILRRLDILEGRILGGSESWDRHRESVRRFVAERCDVGAENECVTSDLMTVFRSWANRNGEDTAIPPTQFGRFLRSCVPGIETRQSRIDGKMARVYKGIGY